MRPCYVHAYILVVNFLSTYFATGTARCSVVETVNFSHFTAGLQHQRIMKRNQQERELIFICVDLTKTYQRSGLIKKTPIKRTKI